MPFAIAAMGALLVLNLRGMREAIKVLLPIFVGFVIVHAVLIIYGIHAHADRLPHLLPQTAGATTALAQQHG